jgi:hypothetical protein
LVASGKKFAQLESGALSKLAGEVAGLMNAVRMFRGAG